MTTQNVGGSVNPTRRTLVKGAAWSVPVVAMGSAAPAMAASGSFVLVPGDACKIPGSSCKPYVKGYVFPFSVTNTWPCDIVITQVTYTVISGTPPADLGFAGLPLTIAQGQSILFLNATSGNSANLTFTVQLTLTYTVTCRPELEPQQAVVSVAVPATPPDCGCPPQWGN